MDRTELIFENIRMLSDQLKHRSFRLKQGEHVRLKKPSRWTSNCKMDILTDDYGPTDSSSSFKRSLATHHTANSGLLSFQNTPFPTASLTSVGLRTAAPILHNVSNFPALFQEPSATSLQSFGPYCSVVQDQETILTPFSRIVGYCSNHLLRTK